MRADRACRINVAGADRQYRRAGRLGIRNARPRSIPEPSRESNSGCKRKAARGRPIQVAWRGGRRFTGGSYPHAVAGDALRQTLSGESLSGVRQQHADDLRKFIRCL